MGIIRSKEWASVSESSQLRVLDVSVLTASSIFWAWFMLSVMQPTFSAPFDPSSEYFAWFRSAALCTITATLLVFVALGRRTTRLLDLRVWEFAALGLATLGGAVAIVGSALQVMAFVLIGAFLMGVSIPYFLLEWCRMYCRRGARTAAPLISGALALGLCIDALISSIDPFVRAVFTVSMPIVITAVLYGIRALSNLQSQGEGAVRFDVHEAYGAAEVFTRDPDDAAGEPGESAGVIPDEPVPFSLSLVIAGLALGFVEQCYFMDGLESGPVLFYSAGVTGVVFLLACRWPPLLRTFMGFLFLLGIVGCLFMTQVEGDAGISPVAYALMAGGFSAFVVGVFSVSGYFTKLERNEVIALFSFSLALMAAGVLCGFALGQSGVIAGLAASLGCDVRLMVGFALIATVALFFHGSSSPLPLFPQPSAAGEGELPGAERPSTPEACADWIADEFSLTEREREVLTHLMKGRSRPRIADILVVSENTVNSHIQRIYRKVGVHSFQELLDFAYREEEDHREP